MKTLIQAVAVAAMLAGGQAARADFVVAQTYDGTGATVDSGSFFGAGNPVGAGFAPSGTFWIGPTSMDTYQLINLAGASGTIGNLSLTVPLSLSDSSVSLNNFTLLIAPDTSGTTGVVAPNLTSPVWSTSLAGVTGLAGNTTLANYTLNLGSTTLDPSQNYWLVLEENAGTTLNATAAPLGDNAVNWYFANALGTAGSIPAGGVSTNPYEVLAANGNTAASTGGGGFLNGPGDPMSSGEAVAFQLTSTPEPGQYAMMALLAVGGAGYWMRRRMVLTPVLVKA